MVVRKDGWFTPEIAKDLGYEISTRLQVQLGATEARTPALRLSGMGSKCPRALWASVHAPGEAEALPPWAEIKFSFGHTIEALAIALAKAAGHEVTGEQDELELAGIKGHRDCVIDGCVVDVKSAASRSFIKFKDGSLRHSDTFGYLEQLDGYLLASALDPLVRVKDRAYLLAIDKQLGHMCLYEHHLREAHIKARAEEYKRIVALDHPPSCECGVVADGEGDNCNYKLDLRASYNAYKYFCFPNLRTFLYAGEIRYLTQVSRRPMNKFGPITEVDRYGQIVYH